MNSGFVDLDDEEELDFEEANGFEGKVGMIEDWEGEKERKIQIKRKISCSLWPTIKVIIKLGW